MRSAVLFPVLFLLFLFLASCGGSSGEGSGRAVEKGIAARIDEGEVEEALAALDGLPPEERSAPWALYQRGRALVKRTGSSGTAGDLDEAASLFRAVLEKDSLSAGARIDLCRLLSGRGRWVEAVKLLEEGRRLDPGNAGYLFQIARTYLAVSEVSGALKAVKEGLALAPGSPEGLFLLGWIDFDFGGRRDKGLEEMRRALEGDRALPGGARKLAEALTQRAVEEEGRKNGEGALPLVEEALRYAPALPGALLEHARLLLGKGRLDEALADLRRARAAAPGDEDVRNLLAGTLKTAGYKALARRERDEALSLFREAVALRAPGVDVSVIERIIEEDGASRGKKGPGTGLDEKEREKDARALFEEGTELLEKGRAEEAAAAFERSLDLLPGNPFARHRLGLARIMLGDLDGGEKELKEAVAEAARMEVALPAAYCKLAELALRRGRPGEARAWLDRRDALYPDRAGDPSVKALRSLLGGKERKGPEKERPRREPPSRS